MASKKIRDIVVTVGEYTDRNTGETKKRYENVGALMQNDDEDGSYFIMLRRTFNPAGIPKQDERESVLLSCYVPRDQRDQQQHNSQGQQRQQSYADASGGTLSNSHQRPLGDDGEEIPF